MSSTEIKLVSGDGVHFTVPRNVAEKSGLIRTTVGFGADTGGGNSSGADGSDGSGTSSTAEQELPIPNVNAAILKSILKCVSNSLCMECQRTEPCLKCRFCDITVFTCTPQVFSLQFRHWLDPLWALLSNFLLPCVCLRD